MLVVQGGLPAHSERGPPSPLPVVTPAPASFQTHLVTRCALCLHMLLSLSVSPSPAPRTVPGSQMILTKHLLNEWMTYSYFADEGSQAEKSDVTSEYAVALSLSLLRPNDSSNCQSWKA